MIVNTLAISQMVYKLFALPTPEKYEFDRLKKLTKKFIWDNNRAKIAYNTMIQPIANGGLKLADLETQNDAIKCTWVTKSNTSTADWVRLAQEFLPMDLAEMWLCNLDPKDAKKLVKNSLIWQSIMVSWAKYNFKKPETAEEILTLICVLSGNLNIQKTEQVCLTCSYSF